MNAASIPTYNNSDFETVLKRLNPARNRACNNNLLWGLGNGDFSGDYYGTSLKRSHLNNVKFNNAVFDHTSFAGSEIINTVFENTCKIESVYFENSLISEVVFEPTLYINNTNFTNCRIKRSQFRNNEIRGSFFNDSILDNCSFEECKIRSTMFENAVMNRCHLSNCNMRNLNIEFCRIINSTLTNTVISFFQFPYIIGIFDQSNNIESVLLGRNEVETLGLDEYINEIDDSIIYFTCIEEYFPLINLYYIKGQREYAYNSTILGIEKALKENNIRLVDYYCSIGKSYKLLTISDLKEIIALIDNHIDSNRHYEFFDVLLSQSSKIKTSILNDNTKSTLEITINTNIDSSDYGAASALCKDIDSIITVLSPAITTSFQMSHNSPFEIVLTCIGLTADIIGISGALYKYISIRSDSVVVSNKVKKYIEKSNELFMNSLSSQFDSFEQLLAKTKKSEQTAVITAFRGKIIESVSHQIENDLSLLIAGSNL